MRAGRAHALLAWWIMGISLAVGGAGDTCLQAAQAESESSQLEQPLPAMVILEPGEIRNIPVQEITRIAVGNPDIADMTIISKDEVLLQAKGAGTTNIILWDQRGEHRSSVEVVDRSLDATEAQLRQLVQELNLPGVAVKQANGVLFLTGEVAKPEDSERVKQMLDAFPKVTDLVQVTVPAPVFETPPMVKLEVQVIEIKRSDLEQLGVNWSPSMKVTEATMPAASLGDTLLRIGQSATRDPLSATLNALVSQSRARILAEPKLVTMSGKEASSFIGIDVPVVEATSFGLGATSGTAQANITFRQTGVLLKMTPVVQDDRKINLVIAAELSDVDKSSGVNVPVGNTTVLVPGFAVRKTNTQVTTVSGETILVAGLLRVNDTHTVSQVPALGSVPVLGRLFRSPQTESSQHEVVVVVTPELLGEAATTADRPAALDQALTRAETTTTPERSSSSSSDPTLRYALQIQGLIAKAIRIPASEQLPATGARVTLRVHLLRDGKLEQAVIAIPSGLPSLDQEALTAATTQAPYPPFPSDLIRQELWLEVPILFRS